MVSMLASSKSKDFMARVQNNVSEWSDMSTHRLLFQWTSTIKIQLIMLVLYNTYIFIIWYNLIVLVMIY